MTAMKIQPRLLLPLMIFVGVMVVGVRAGDVWQALTSDAPFPPVAQAEAADEKPSKYSSTSTDGSSQTGANKEAAAQPPAKTEEAKPESKRSEEPSERPRPSSAPKETASPESDLYKQLVGRRDQLDKRASELDEREALVVVAEKRIDQKIKEMETMRGQLQTLVGQADAAQQAQIENLVKIYEIMKPKEAAKIFETLELPVILGVVQKMKPARTAAVMAEMNPEKAKEITVALTKRDQLPQIK